MGELILILGGARSGKSRFAERLASEDGGRVTYLATLEPGDEEMRRRVELHRAHRPREWVTIEEPLNLTEALSRAATFDVCLLDCLTLWVSNLVGGCSADLVDENERVHQAAMDRVRRLLEWQEQQSSQLIVVSNEVGSGLVPEYPVGRLYRDLLGEANQLVAAAADKVYFCVAGFALDVRALGIPTR